MQQPASDLAFAQAVLEGQVATKGPWHAQRQSSGTKRGTGGPGRGAGRQGGRVQSGRHAGSAAAKRRRQQHQQQQQQAGRHARPQQQDARTSSSSSENSGSSSSESSQLAAYSRPGDRSTARAAFCTACDVWVPRRAGDWEVRLGQTIVAALLYRSTAQGCSASHLERWRAPLLGIALAGAHVHLHLVGCHSAQMEQLLSMVYLPRLSPICCNNPQVHVAGIRHRRQLLSLRVHGERNRLVLSAFESLPGEWGEVLVDAVQK